MGRADEFLNLYREMEELLVSRYSGKKKRFSSVIMQFSSEPDGKRWQEELNLCRDIRNLLSHHSLMDGERVVEPSQKLVDFLANVNNYLRNPPRAKDIATPISSLLVATENTRIKELMNEMGRRGFSHVPVMRGESLYGIFSVGTFFAYIRETPEARITNEDTLKKFSRFLPHRAHITEQFRFVRPDAEYYSLKEYFNEGGPGARRLAAVFVTASGKPASQLLGMITPWDMLRTEPCE